MSAELFERAVHAGMELYPGDTEARQRYVDWYIKTNCGTNFDFSMPIIGTFGIRNDDMKEILRK